MEHDRPARGRARVVLRQHGGDVLVGEAVESVALHALPRQLLGQREHLGHRRVAAMERRVEAGDLRQFRPPLEQHPDRGQVVRLVQRRERRQRAESLHDVAIHQDRLRERGAAVDDAMAHPGQPMFGHLAAEKAGQVLEGAVVPEVRPVAPGSARRRRSPVRSFATKRGVRVQPFGLPAHHQIEFVTARGEERELDGRGSGVDDQDGVSHGA